MFMDYRKVYGGTPVGTQSRCDSCSHSHVVKGYSAKELIVICEWAYPSVRIPFPVSDCSHYANGRLPDYEDLEKIALDLTRVKSARTGFVGKKHNRSEEREPATAVALAEAEINVSEDEG